MDTWISVFNEAGEWCVSAPCKSRFDSRTATCSGDDKNRLEITLYDIRVSR